MHIRSYTFFIGNKSAQLTRKMTADFAADFFLPPDRVFAMEHLFKIKIIVHTAQIICIAVPNSYSEIAVHKEYAAWISTSTKKLYSGSDALDRRSAIHDPELDPIFLDLDRI